MNIFPRHSTMSLAAKPAFALSLPVQPRTPCNRRMLCSYRPVFPSVSRARATMGEAEDDSDNVTPPSMTVTASRTVEETGFDLNNLDAQKVGKVKTMLEFWFSPSNLRRDWFLRKQMDDDGWLDPAVFLMFNKVKGLNATIEDIVAASNLSDELEVSVPAQGSFGDDARQTRIRRSPELPDFRSREDMEYERSFIISGFADGATVDDLVDVFANISPASYIKIYRNKNLPEPRALVCFPSVEIANNVFEKYLSVLPDDFKDLRLRKRAAGETAGSVNQEFRIPSTIVCELNGIPQGWNWKRLHKYLDQVFLDAVSMRLKFLMYTPGTDYCYLTLNDAVNVRQFVTKLIEEGILMAENVVSLRLLEQEDELKEYWRQASELQAMRTARRAEKQAKQDSLSSPEALMIRNPVGVIAKIEGLPEDAKWPQIKAGLSRLGNVRYLNYNEGSTSCYCRFGTATEAKEAIEKLTDQEADVKLCGQYVDASILEGEEEVAYWRRTEEYLRGRQNNSLGSASSEEEA